MKLKFLVFLGGFLMLSNFSIKPMEKRSHNIINKTTLSMSILALVATFNILKSDYDNKGLFCTTMLLALSAMMNGEYLKGERSKGKNTSGSSDEAFQKLLMMPACIFSVLILLKYFQN